MAIPKVSAVSPKPICAKCFNKRWRKLASFHGDQCIKGGCSAGTRQPLCCSVACGPTSGVVSASGPLPGLSTSACASEDCVPLPPFPLASRCRLMEKFLWSLLAQVGQVPWKFHSRERWERPERAPRPAVGSAFWPWSYPPWEWFPWAFPSGRSPTLNSQFANTAPTHPTRGGGASAAVGIWVSSPSRWALSSLTNYVTNSLPKWPSVWNAFSGLCSGCTLTNIHQ